MQSLLKVSSQCISISLLRDQTTYIESKTITIELSIHRTFYRFDFYAIKRNDNRVAVENGFGAHNTPVHSPSATNSRSK